MAIQKITSLTGSYAADATSPGGPITLTAGDGGATSGAGGAINLTAGERFDAGAGAAISLVGGAVDFNSESFFGGAINITGGANAYAGEYASGGSVNITGGAANNAGNVELVGGLGGSNTGAKGGSVNLTAGTSTDGRGGEIDLRAGAGTGTNRIGGFINLFAGNSTGNAIGGPIAFTAGDGVDATGGAIDLTAGDGQYGGPINITGGVGYYGSGDVTIRGGAFGDYGDTNYRAGDVKIFGGDGNGGNGYGYGGVVEILGGPSGSNSDTAGGVSLTGGDGSTFGSGGDATVQGGRGDSPGFARLQGGLAQGTSTTGGTAQVFGGNGSGPAGNGGAAELRGGFNSGGSAGAVIIAAPLSSGVYKGGNVTIDSGRGGTTGDGGDITILCGDGGTGSGDGGVLSMSSGPGSSVGVGTGGALNITSGDSGAGATGDGGVLTIESGAAVSTNGDGGDIVLIPGVGNGAGSAGAINITQTTAPSTTTDRLYNVAGALTWNGVDISTAGLAAVVEDTTPELGGILDVGGFVIGSDLTGNKALLGLNTSSASELRLAAGTGEAAQNMTIRGGASDTSSGGDVIVEGGSGLVPGDVFINGGAGTSTIQSGIILQSGTTTDNKGGFVVIAAPGGSTVAPTLDLREAAVNGANDIALRAPVSVTTSRTWTLPQDDPTAVAGQFLTTSSGGVLLFAVALTELIDDTSPELGGFLDTKGHAIATYAAPTPDVILIQAGSSSSGGNKGGDLDLRSGGGSTTGDGGEISLIAGAAGPSGSNVGGPILISGGSSGASVGGKVSILGGDSTGGAGGLIEILSGIGDTNSAGGDINIISGDGGATAGNAGDIVITPGTAAGSGDPGSIIMTGPVIVSNDIVIDFGDRIRLDGNEAGDTYIANVSTDVIRILTGNVEACDFSATGLFIRQGIFWQDRADHPNTPSAGFGELWVKDDTPTALVFTDGAGNDYQVAGGGIATLADDATPTVAGGRIFITGGTTTITDFDDGFTGQEIVIMSEHAITITDGTNIILNGSVDFVMAAADTLTLIQKADTLWYETARMVNL